MPHILLVANWDWVLYNFRLPLAAALRAAGHRLTMVCPTGQYTPKLRAAGYEVVDWQLSRRSTNPISETLSLVRLRSLYAELQPDLVHHFTIKPNFYGSAAASRIRRRRPCVINTFTGLGFYFSHHRRAAALRTALNPILRRILGHPANWTVFQNQPDRDTFVTYRLAPRHRTRVIPGSGVDTDRFRPTSRPGNRLPVVLTGARLLWDKGIADIIEAEKLLRLRGVPVEFRIAGAPDEGNLAAIPAIRLDQWRAEGHVRFLGHVDDMQSALADADIALLPSYHEGTPRFLLEAAACGLPLIATDIPGCQEVVQQNVNGLLVPVKSPAAIAGAVEQLLSEPNRRSAYGQAARDFVLRHHSQTGVINQYLNLYTEVLAS